MLLKQVGLHFDIISSKFEESLDYKLPPEQLAEYLAFRKADLVAASLSEGIVVGADTIVVDKHGMLGKPQDEHDAYQMLSRLSDQIHRVITGIALISTGAPTKVLVRHETTRVKITTLSDQMIKEYIRTGEPLDKAGAYAIQGKGTMFVEWIHGCYNNVVGLPVFLFMKMLREITST
jgi:septum formation protein